MSQTYAVVDIETTGTDVKHDKIIQIGCVLIEDGKIVGEYATDVNPNRAVSKQIQNLTGLTSKRLKKAPYFEEIAPSLASFLEDTIFVAHNIGFDYHFLSEALKEVGEKPLTMPGVDTVSLSQILFPCELSFKLKDLANSFHFIHENPHQANSDAKVTAELFLKLRKQLYEIPLVTLKTMLPLLFSLPYETGNWVTEIYELRLKKEVQTDYPQLYFKNNLAFQIIPHLIKNQQLRENVYSYPLRKKDKLKYYPKEYNYRKMQGKMMNRVFHFFKEEEEKDFFLEAPFGLGKSFGYLFPLFFLKQEGKKAVIATSTYLLQNQLLQDVKKLTSQLPFSFEGVILKSGKNYLSLHKFYQSLNETETSKKIALYKLMLLNWLLVTKTGDFSELNLLKKDELYFIQISALNLEKENNPFFEFEYFHLIQEKAKIADVVITNHAYLIEESHVKLEKLLAADYLIFDEAHHLSDLLTKKKSYIFQYQEIKKQIFYREGKANISNFTPLLKSHEKDFQHIESYFKDRYPEDIFYLNRQNFSQLPEKVKAAFDGLKKLEKELEQCLALQKEDYNGINEIISKFKEGLAAFLTIEEKSLSWIQKMSGKVTFEVAPMVTNSVKTENWYQMFSKILYVGGSFYFGKKNLLQEELGLPLAVTKRLNSPYSYENQLLCLQAIPSSNQTEEEALVLLLKEYLKEIKKPLLVLFTSFESLSRVYYKIQPTALEESRELLGQDVNGSKEKVLKRFRLGDSSILLGNASFFEGVDLPEDSLEILFISKLPFENPNWPVTKLTYQRLEKEGRNPFYEKALPACVLKLNQALGRLIRSEQDRGVAVIFDERLTESSYQQKIQKNLTPGITVIKKEVAKISGEIKTFLDL